MSTAIAPQDLDLADAVARYYSDPRVSGPHSARACCTIGHDKADEAWGALPSDGLEWVADLQEVPPGPSFKVEWILP